MVGLVLVDPRQYDIDAGADGSTPAQAVLFSLGFLLISIGVLVSLGSMVLRWRRSQGEQRQQVRLIAASAALISIGLVVLFFVQLFNGGTQTWASSLPLYVSYFLLPILLGQTASGFATMLCTLVLYEGCYLSEVVRAGIEALPARLRAVHGDIAVLAKESKLVDTLAPRDEVRKRLIALTGEDKEKHSFKQIGYGDYLKSKGGDRSGATGRGKAIAVVVAKGTILDGTQPAGTIDPRYVSS